MSDKPTHRIQVSNIAATIWENQSQAGKTFHTVTFPRSYKDESGQWKDTHSYGVDDLANLLVSVQMALTHLHIGIEKKPASFVEKVEEERTGKKANAKG